MTVTTKARPIAATTAIIHWRLSSTGAANAWSRPVSDRDDPGVVRRHWELAERILREEAAAISAGETAERAIRDLEQRYPVPQTEIEPRVFVSATDNYIELAARFVVPVREARTRKSEMVKKLLRRFEASGIEVASATMDVTFRRPGDVDGG